VLGERERAREWMERALLVDPDNLNMRYNFACALARDLDDRDGAIRMLESCIPRLKGSLGNIEFDPDLDNIRDDPRFQRLLKDALNRRGVKPRTVTAPAAS
jgi:adenylate cyclase